MTGAERAAWGLGAAGLLAALLGWLFQPALFPHAWLAALVFWSGWPLGSMALILVHALTGGRWGEALRPALRLGTSSLVLLPPALVPVVLSLPALYPWARPEVAEHLGNRFYLNVPFFAGRGVVYLVVWFGLAGLILRGRALDRVAPPGLILLAFTATFAAIDATMSLDPSFNSSAYGMMAAAGMGLLALSAAVLLAGTTLPPAALADTGKLLLGLVVLWVYLDFMQMLIVWESDLASEAPWYVRRMHGFWGAALAVIAAGHVLLPIGLLIFPRVQRRRVCVVGVAVLLVAMEALRSWWTVLPAVPRGPSWLDVACLLAFGGLACGVALRAGRPFLARAARQHG